MPTRRPRHTVTETPPVERALRLRRLRALRPGQRIDFQELVALGAERKAQQLEREGDEGERRLGVLHYDHDYDVIASHSGLTARSVWITPRGSMS